MAKATLASYQKALEDAKKAGKTVVVEARTVSKTSSGVSMFGVFVTPKPRRINMAQLEGFGPKYVAAFFADDKIEIALGAE